MSWRVGAGGGEMHPAPSQAWSFIDLIRGHHVRFLIGLAGYKIFAVVVGSLLLG